jgi:hypothetical protein
MKSFNEYLTESKKMFEYRVKVAGELDTDQFKNLKRALEQFDIEGCTDPKKTPIVKDPFGFPGLENTEIHIFDITLNYPASSEQIVELARMQGFDPNRVRVLSKDYDDSMTKELEGVEQTDKAKLETPDYPAQTKEQKAASTKYSEGFKDIVQNAASTKFEIAGEKTPPAKFNTDNKVDVNSPLSKVKRPAKKDMAKR